MDENSLYDELDNSREQLLVLLDGLTDEEILHPNTIGNWSIADFLVHLAIWEAELVTGLMKIKKGQKPTNLLKALNSRDQYIHTRVTKAQGRELERVFDDLQRARFHLEQWVGKFRVRDLTNPKKYKWLKGRTLWHLIGDCSFKHEAKHLPALEAAINNLSKPIVNVNSIEVLND